MKKIKDVFLPLMVCLCLVLSLVFVGCNDEINDNATTNNELTPSVETETELNKKIANAVEGVESIILSEEQKQATLPTDYLTNANFVDGTTTINSKGTKYVLDDEGVSYYFLNSDDSVLNLTAQISIEADNIHVYFGNVRITNAGKKCISASNEEDANGDDIIGTACDALLTILEGKTVTINNIKTGKDSTDKNAISCDAGLVINGSGTLNITSNKSGIKADNGVVILGTDVVISANYIGEALNTETFTKTTAEDYCGHGIKGSFIYLDGATINITKAGKDGLHAEMGDLVSEFNYADGFVYSKNSTITIGNGTDSIHCDGIQADTFVYIESGVYTLNNDLQATSYWQNATNVTGNGSYFTRSGVVGNYTYKKVPSDEINTSSSNYYELIESCKGIKVGEIDYYLTKNDADSETNEQTLEDADYIIYITGGQFNITTLDDAIHADSGDIVINNGDITINTWSDAIHADDALLIDNGTILIEYSYEGLEGESVTINNGTITIFAVDDGMNAANKILDQATSTTSLTETSIEANLVAGPGGMGGPGIGGPGGMPNSNSNQAKYCYIRINGGTIYINASGDGIDSNGNIYVTGGNIYVYGPNNAGNEGLDCGDSNCVISISGGTIVVLDATGASQKISSSLNCISRNLSSKTDIRVATSQMSTDYIVEFNVTSLWPSATKVCSRCYIYSSSFTSGSVYYLNGNSVTAR